MKGYGTDTGNADDDCYSQLSQIEKYKIGGKYTFKFVYPGEWSGNECPNSTCTPLVVLWYNSVCSVYVCLN